MRLREQIRVGAAAVACLILLLALFFGLTHGGARRAEPGTASQLLVRDARIVNTALNAFKQTDGRWMPSMYSSSTWEKYQDPAVADAALAVERNDTAARDRAVHTMDAAITDHQLPDGDFDNGTAALGSSGVDGGFWAEAEGLTALILRSSVAPATYTSWVTSMERYVDYLQKSDASGWYANGNVVLRTAVIMLETYQLARSDGAPAAERYWRDYLFERHFLVTGNTGRADTPYLGERGDGLQRGINASLWFSESSIGNVPSVTCANGESPCDGFDPNYAAAQLSDAIVGYLVGGDQDFWRQIIRGEYAALQPRIHGGFLDAADGSRDNIASELFYPPAYWIMRRLHMGDYEDQWAAQIKAFAQQLTMDESNLDPGPNAYSLLLPLALPLIPLSAL
jgi:hypothetical protein